jgi:hypothetical protein
VSIPIAHCGRTRSPLDRVQIGANGRSLKLLNPFCTSKFGSDMPPHIGFELRYVEARPPYGVAGQPSLGRLNSVSTAACFDRRVAVDLDVFCWKVNFACLAFARLFALDRVALARLLLVLMSVPLKGRSAPARCTTATPRRPIGAGGGEDARPDSHQELTEILGLC